MSAQQECQEYVAGRDMVIPMFLTDDDGCPQSLAGWTKIQLRLAGKEGVVTFKAPLDLGQDAAQTISWSLVPDAGSYTITVGDETTASLAFDADNATIQTALRALDCLAGVVVSGDYSAGHSLSFEGDDGKRVFAAVVVTPSGLLNGTTSVTAAVTVVETGRAKGGIEVVSPEEAGQLKLHLNEVTGNTIQTDQALVGDLQVRIGEEDLNIAPIRNFLCVVEDPVNC